MKMLISSLSALIPSGIDVNKRTERKFHFHQRVLRYDLQPFLDQILLVIQHSRILGTYLHFHCSHIHTTLSHSTKSRPHHSNWWSRGEEIIVNYYYSMKRYSKYCSTLTGTKICKEIMEDGSVAVVADEQHQMNGIAMIDSRKWVSTAENMKVGISLLHLATLMTQTQCNKNQHKARPRT